MTGPGHGRVQRFAIQADIIAGLAAVTQLGEFAIDGDPAGADPLFNGAARAMSAGGQQFL